MPMEGWVKCLSPQNTFGVSGVHSVAAKSNTIEVTGDSFFKLQTQHTSFCPWASTGVLGSIATARCRHTGLKYGVNDRLFTIRFSIFRHSATASTSISHLQSITHYTQYTQCFWNLPALLSLPPSGSIIHLQ